MTVLTNALRELAGLFVDDGALALVIIAVVVLAGLVAMLMPDASWAGAILLLGCLAALLSSVARAARR